MTSSAPVQSLKSATLADVLERVLDKGLVIAGDIQIKIADVELLTIKIRLMIASVDKAKEMGIDWWERDSYLSSAARETEQAKRIDELQDKIQQLESEVTEGAGPQENSQASAAR